MVHRVSIQEVGEDEEKGDAKNACVFAPDVECGGDGEFVLVLLGSEDREREDVELAEEETAAEMAAEWGFVRGYDERSWTRCSHSHRMLNLSKSIIDVMSFYFRLTAIIFANSCNICE